MTDRTLMAPGSAIITASSYEKQRVAAGRYRQSGRYRKRCWIAPRSIHRKMQALVFGRDGHVCVECQSDSDLHLDHIVPYVHGGLYIEWNLHTLCGTCNSRKGARTNGGETRG